ncbi:MAG: gfo/Idh/MocA family oxidoreductase [Planctomycetota bacterium]|jgi:predicted dehydrogenase|nr:MAG: gfo/Idh/MocA family oxidoreductase [Planctomycetota bacterium]
MGFGTVENRSRVDSKQGNMQKLRIAVIGLGSDWQHRYLPALRSLRDRFGVVGVYHSVSALAAAAARELDSVGYDSFRSLISNPSVEAILMLEDDWYQLQPLWVACEAQKGIFCGSEVDIQGMSSSGLQEAISSSGIPFMSGFSRRYAPATLRFKELIATRLGRPRLLFCHRRLPSEPPDPANSVSLEKQTNRELLELIDWCTYIVDEEPDWVQAIRHLSRPSPTNADYQILSLGFGDPETDPNAILAQISCGAYIPSVWAEAIAFRPPAAVQVCCEKGLVFIDLPSTLVWFDDAGRHQETLDTELPIGQQMLIQFHRAVASKVSLVSDLQETNEAIRILEKAKLSTQTHQRVSLRDGIL